MLDKARSTISAGSLKEGEVEIEKKATIGCLLRWCVVEDLL